MSDSMNYLHGAGVQEIIDATRHSSDIDRVSAAWSHTADVLHQRINERDATIQKLNQELAETRMLLAGANGANDAIRQSLKEAYEKMAQREREFRAAFGKMGSHIDSEAGDIHDVTIDWICRYGENQSHEFVQGLRHLFKYHMPMSQSESLRNQFLKDFEAKAKEMAKANEAAGKGYFVSEEDLQRTAGGLATGIAIREQARLGRLLAKKTGLDKEIGAGRRKEQAGPDDIAKAVGEGNFTPPEDPGGAVGYLYPHLPSQKSEPIKSKD